MKHSIVCTLLASCTVITACSTSPRQDNTYRCDTGGSFNLAFDKSARTAILRIPDTESLVLPRAPGGPPERYSDGSITVEDLGDNVRVLRNERVIAQGCRTTR